MHAYLRVDILVNLRIRATYCKLGYVNAVKYDEYEYDTVKFHSISCEIPNSVADIMDQLVASGHINSIRCKTTGLPHGAPGGTFVPGGGVVIPCIYKIYGDEIDRDTVRNALRNHVYDAFDGQ